MSMIVFSFTFATYGILLPRRQQSVWFSSDAAASTGGPQLTVAGRRVG